MNMPGFTGEASLYKTSRHYYEAGNLTQTDGVYSALSILHQLPPVLDFPFATLCCSSCQSDCVRQCWRAGGSRNPDYFECVKACGPRCTKKCNALGFGGCD